MRSRVISIIILLIFLIPPVFPKENEDLERLEGSVNRLNKKVERLEKTMEEINRSSSESESIFYADINQTKMPVYPDYSSGPYTVRNNFSVISFVSMSNRKGERAAFVTLKNQGTRTRISRDYIIATFADNTRVIAHQISTEESVGEDGYVSLTAYFGKKDYPVVDVATR